jgi:hypothetical protein
VELPLAVPTNLTAKTNSSDSITLGWSDNSEAEDGYKVECKTEGASFSLISTIGKNVETYTDTQLSAGTKYYYRAKAFNASKQSAYSNETSARTSVDISGVLDSGTITLPGSSGTNNAVIKIPGFKLPGGGNNSGAGSQSGSGGGQPETGADTPSEGGSAGTASPGSMVLTMQIGNPAMSVSGADQEIDPGRGTAPVIVGGRTMVPIRAIIEALGGSIDWSDPEQKAIVKLKGSAVELWIGKNSAKVNGVEKISDVAPQLINDRTMLPLRFVSENLGCSVQWLEEYNAVVITYIP